MKISAFDQLQHKLSFRILMYQKILAGLWEDCSKFVIFSAVNEKKNSKLLEISGELGTNLFVIFSAIGPATNRIIAADLLFLEF